MAHGAKIGGTSYGISGGKCKVGGTAYSILNGKTKVGGTAYDISFGPPALADCTPAEIQAVAQSGEAANYWAVGDKTAGITLNGTVGTYTFSNETHYAFIIGFDHNSTYEGSNTIHFQFGKTSAGVDIAFVDSSYGSTGGTDGGFQIGSSSGWEASTLRSTTCPAFLSAMPSAWQDVIASCTKYTCNTSGYSTAAYVTSTSDKIWLLAEFEVFGARTNANTYEKNYQKQYTYYSAGNSKIKYKHNDTATACIWWTRSASYATKSKMCYVSAAGATATAYYYSSYGFAPAFMVA